jgi:hypothetical protein
MLYRIYLEYLGDSAKAEEILRELRKKDVGNDLISMADELMGDFRNGTLKRKLTDSEIANLVNNRVPKEVSDVKEVPSEFGISQNYPNPFNPVTTIKFAIPQASNVKMVVYNMLGQEIETLVNDNINAGYHEIKWNGSRCASGIYICRFEAGGYNKAIKLLLIK